MSARHLLPKHRSAWLLAYSSTSLRALERGSSLGQCEHGHWDCAPVWGGTCGAEVIGAYQRIRYRGARIELRWTPVGWQHAVEEAPWSGPWESRALALSDAAERIDTRGRQ